VNFGIRALLVWRIQTARAYCIAICQLPLRSPLYSPHVCIQAMLRQIIDAQPPWQAGAYRTLLCECVRATGAGLPRHSGASESWFYGTNELMCAKGRINRHKAKPIALNLLKPTHKIPNCLFYPKRDRV